MSAFEKEENKEIISFYEITRENTWEQEIGVHTAWDMARRINKFWSHIKKPYFEWGGNFYMTEKALNGEFEELVIP